MQRVRERDSEREKKVVNKHTAVTVAVWVKHTTTKSTPNSPSSAFPFFRRFFCAFFLIFFLLHINFHFYYALLLHAWLTIFFLLLLLSLPLFLIVCRNMKELKTRNWYESLIRYSLMVLAIIFFISPVGKREIFFFLDFIFLCKVHTMHIALSQHILFLLTAVPWWRQQTWHAKNI